MYVKNKFDHFCNRLKEKYPNENLEVLEYTGAKEPATVKCNNCNNVYKNKYGEHFLDKRKEKICTNCIPRKDTKEIGNKIKYVFEHNNNIELLNQYTKITDDLQILCKKCNTIFIRKPQVLLKSQKCPKCETHVKFKTKEVFEYELQTKLNGEYSLIGEYEGTNTRTLFKHNDCGFIFNNTPHNILQKTPCPKCKKFNSKGEIAIQKILDLHNIVYIQQYRTKELELLSFDFYIPKNKTFIEFQGEQHFHPIKFFGGKSKYLKQVENDNNKRQYCKNNNFSLIEIAYTDINNIEEILSFLWLND